jgi:hypothetical protein
VVLGRFAPVEGGADGLEDDDAPVGGDGADPKADEPDVEPSDDGEAASVGADRRVHAPTAPTEASVSSARRDNPTPAGYRQNPHLTGQTVHRRRRSSKAAEDPGHAWWAYETGT